MNKLTLLGMAAAITVSGTAFAQGGPPADPYGDATVAKAEAQKGDEGRFAGLDANKDGNLSADEIAAAPRGGRGLGRSDANGDGAISQAEFVASQGQRFDMQDSNKDGQLTKAERDAFRQQMMERRRTGGGGPGGPPPAAPGE